MGDCREKGVAERCKSGRRPGHGTRGTGLRPLCVGAKAGGTRRCQSPPTPTQTPAAGPQGHPLGPGTGSTTAQRHPPPPSVLFRGPPLQRDAKGTGSEGPRGRAGGAARTQHRPTDPGRTCPRTGAGADLRAAAASDHRPLKRGPVARGSQHMTPDPEGPSLPRGMSHGAELYWACGCPRRPREHGSFLQLGTTWAVVGPTHLTPHPHPHPHPHPPRDLAKCLDPTFSSAPLKTHCRWGGWGCWTHPP